MVPMSALREYGVLLESARGPIPNVAELIAGEPIRGSWWGHPASHAIFDAINRLADSPDVVRTRLIAGKVTLIHRRLWPALVRVADRLPVERLAAIHEEHGASGAHRVHERPFPSWVPDDVTLAAKALSDDEAVSQLPVCVVALLTLTSTVATRRSLRPGTSEPVEPPSDSQILTSLGPPLSYGRDVAVRPAGAVTFLLADIEGPTSRWERQSEATRAELAEHDAIVRTAIEAGGGEVVRHTGEGFMAVFGDPIGAVAAAVECQRRLAESTLGDVAGPHRAAHGAAGADRRRRTRPGSEPGGPCHDRRPRWAGADVGDHGGPRPRRAPGGPRTCRRR